MRLRELWRGLVVCGLLLVAGPRAGAAAVVQAWFTTADQAKLMAREADAAFGVATPRPVRIDVHPVRRYQDMVGFGAAITDASAWLIETRLNATQRAALLELVMRA